MTGRQMIRGVLVITLPAVLLVMTGCTTIGPSQTSRNSVAIAGSETTELGRIETASVGASWRLGLSADSDERICNGRAPDARPGMQSNR